MPVFFTVEMLLNESKIKVAVYNGNLDVITPIAGKLIFATSRKPILIF